MSKLVFENQVCLITGASRGIGAATAVELAKRGAQAIIINYLGSKEKANIVTERIREIGPEALSVQCNVSDFEQCSNMIDTILSQFGHVDVLINNAGITKDNLLLNMNPEDFDELLAVNLKGCFNTMRCLAKQFIRNKYGRIVNVSSVSAIYGIEGQVNYSASKAGIIGLTKSAAREFAARNITCNVVAPGFIDTDMLSAMNEGVRKKILEKIAVRRFGKPEEVASVIAFLASREASYITGQIIEVSGGMTLC